VLIGNERNCQRPGSIHGIEVHNYNRESAVIGVVAPASMYTEARNRRQLSYLSRIWLREVARYPDLATEEPEESESGDGSDLADVVEGVSARPRFSHESLSMSPL
jgi:hypothetical protein